MPRDFCDETKMASERFFTDVAKSYYAATRLCPVKVFIPLLQIPGCLTGDTVSAPVEALFASQKQTVQDQWFSR